MRHLLRNSLVLAALVCVPLAASASDPLARFDGGIGSQPLRAVAPGAPATNDVNGTPPGGRPWVISDLKATVRSDGRIEVDGRGLLLGGGADVGRTAGQSVRARLFCAGVPHDSEQLVPLEPNGDFRIRSFLLPTPPMVCANPTLLIINANGSWFAAGIPKQP